MHTMIKSADQKTWTVGVWLPPFSRNDDGEIQQKLHWSSIRDFNTEADAAAYVSWLNGGPMPQFVGTAGMPARGLPFYVFLNE